jgi:hypothetical protein
LPHVRKTAAGTWQARYRAPDGRERAHNFRRKVDAEAFLATVEADKLRGEWTDPRRSRITFGEWNTRVQEGPHSTSETAKSPATTGDFEVWSWGDLNPRPLACHA